MMQLWRTLDFQRFPLLVASIQYQIMLSLLSSPPLLLVLLESPMVHSRDCPFRLHTATILEIGLLLIFTLCTPFCTLL
jgi:hypothetical protein